MNVNDARKQLSTQKSRSLENLPPSQETLKQHIKRDCFQSNCWNKALLSNQMLRSPADWGWKLGATGWEPLWTILPEASLSCYELIHCGCKKRCATRRCKLPFVGCEEVLQCMVICLQGEVLSIQVHLEVSHYLHDRQAFHLGDAVSGLRVSQLPGLQGDGQL